MAAQAFKYSRATSQPYFEPSIYITIFRALFFGFGLLALNASFGAELNPLVIIIASIIGALIGSKAARSTLRSRGFFTAVGIGLVSWYALRATGDQINPGNSAFSWYVFSRSVELYLCIGTIIGIFEWLYRRTQTTWLTIETFLIGAVAISAMAAHRLFRLDTPRAIAEIAWNWNTNPIGVFIGAGSALTFIIVVFLGVCSKPHTAVRDQLTKRTAISGVLVLCAAIAIIALVAFRLSTVSAGTRLMNGVGQDNKEGVSPLTFQSALGATNQPAALVRLESDYTDNPNSPMLYMREDALSDFNGTEMVHAGNAYDRDVISSPPSAIFKAQEDASLTDRIPLPHAVYLLADHKIPFAIDFPVSLIPLKNPNPSKFKLAYRAYSQAPIYKLEDIKSDAVGNPAWDEVERQHYLKTNSDERYTNLAVDITTGVSAPVERAFALGAYLSAKSIYTLAPNHEETKGDQTAPYLFGDMRGYCVHFAHAMVYMLRSLGIPARIGTGYLTDLSQAKDGHILLRMSDRHAWAEVYVTSKGWVPFDVQPEQVESHGDSEVDMKLLEDLMSQLDPGEEILPKEPSKHEPALDRQKPIAWEAYLPGWQQVVAFLLAVLSTIALLKYAMKHLLWRLPLLQSTKIKLGYRAQMMAAADLGIIRAVGETRAEFESRAKAILGANPVSHTTTLNQIRFGDSAKSLGDSSAPRFIAEQSLIKRIFVWISPFSIWRFFFP